ncbi:MAG TPA: SDR family NAD(P)-dependent oxidoreductase [Nocardioides sp.]
MGLLLTTPIARARRLLRTVTGDSRSPLAGRTIMVTGASSGIGEATALACGARGATVLLVARRADALDRVRAAIESGGGAAYCFPLDLTDGDAVDRLVRRVTAEFGPVDHLVNNAGRSIRRSLDLTYDRFHDVERTIAINYLAPVRLTPGLLPGMRAQGFGHVVNVVTWGVQVKSPKFAAYIASKAALDVFGRIAGREAYRDGVAVTNLRFGLVRTEMVAPTEAYGRVPALSPEQAAAIVVRALEDRPVTVDLLSARVLEIANIVAPRLTDLAFSLPDRAFPTPPPRGREWRRPAVGRPPGRAVGSRPEGEPVRRGSGGLRGKRGRARGGVRKTRT